MQSVCFVGAVGEHAQSGLHVGLLNAMKGPQTVFKFATMSTPGALLTLKLQLRIKGIHGSCSRAAVPPSSE